jgi:protocatechuate 3,4-dioxygenase beta subunit
MGHNVGEKIDSFRRALVRAGFTVGASALSLRSMLTVAEETLTYPSKDDILPKEWSGYGDCIFTAVAGEGPYYLEGTPVRRDIREDQVGQELLLRFEVVDVIRCVPLPDALVQIWHSNSAGFYSGYEHIDPNVIPVFEGLGNHAPSQGPDRFLRGAQVSDQNGKCEFLTIFPGWYAGRTVHIHAKVHFNDSRLITSQLYFPQQMIDEIHQTGLYQERGVSRYRNATDVDLAIASGAPGSWPAITREGDRYIATLRIGVLNPHFDHVPPA